MRSLSKVARQRYARHVLVGNVISSYFSKSPIGVTGVDMVFSKEDSMCINHRDSDLLVITVKHGNWDMKCVLIDLRSLTGVLFWDVFYKVRLNLNGIQSFTGSVTGLSGERIQIMGCGPKNHLR